MKGVIYARFSSHNQREESIEQQVEACREYAASNGIEVVEVYADEAISGRTDKRPQFQRMMRDLAKGKFERVIAYKTNRIARDMLNALKFEEKLEKHGCQACYVKEEYGENAAGRFMLRMMLNMNQFYSENLAEDVRRGMLDNASKFMVTGALPYGYKKSPDGRYAINEEQAPIVREIFERVAKGEQNIRIAEDLNSRGVRTKSGKPWGRSSFQTILHNERYAGVYIFEDVRAPGEIPAIVSRELFDRVQHICTHKPHPQGRKQAATGAEYLLTGKLFCGECGEKMTGHSGTSRTGKLHTYYCCVGKCGAKSWQRDKLEELVTRYAVEIALSDEVIGILADVAVEYVEEQKREDVRPQIEAEIEERRSALNNCMAAIERGVVVDTVIQRMAALEAEIREREELLQALSREVPQFDREKFIFALEQYRGDYTDKLYQRLIISSFIKRVTVYDDRIELDYFTGGPGKSSHNVDGGGPTTAQANFYTLIVYHTWARIVVSLRN